MSELFEKAIVEKRNVLNEIRSNSMSLQEMRLFSIYLSKINPRDISTRVVRFPMEDFQKIMGIGVDMNMNHFRYAIRHILQQIVEVPNEKGSGYTAFQLFKKAVVEKDENSEWYVELDAHDMALPLMFDFKEKYFNYELWNALRLKSTNQLRMYEILKQYEKIGKRELSVQQLRELLGIGKNEYSGRTGWSDFKKKVLDSCQAALKATTDICYTYERGKTGAGGKWLTIIFHIEKNPDYVDRLSLKEFIDLQPAPAIVPQEQELLEQPEQQKPVIVVDKREGETEQEENLRLINGITYYEFTPKQAKEIEKTIGELESGKWEKMELVKAVYEKFLSEVDRKSLNGEVIINRYPYFAKMLQREIEAQKVRKEIERHQNDWMAEYL